VSSNSDFKDCTLQLKCEHIVFFCNYNILSKSMFLSLQVGSMGTHTFEP